MLLQSRPSSSGGSAGGRGDGAFTSWSSPDSSRRASSTPGSFRCWRSQQPGNFQQFLQQSMWLCSLGMCSTIRQQCLLLHLEFVEHLLKFYLKVQSLSPRWEALTHSGSPFQSPLTTFTFRWEMPEGSWMKLNVDGCAKSSFGPSAAGGLLRNYSGEIIFSFCLNLGSSSAYLAELQAALLGLRIFEAFLEIKSIMSSLCWRCSHIWREANATADLLALAGLTSPLLEMILDPKIGAPFIGVVALDAAGLRYW